LGNFVTCLSGYDTQYKTKCCRSSTSLLNKKKFWCHNCSPVVKEATSHFMHCPTFSEQFHKITSNRQQTEMQVEGRIFQNNRYCTPNINACEIELECWEELGRIIDGCTRHLCKNKCYLRAFAPIRDWRSLRDEISEMTGKSPDHHLGRWKCHLARKALGEDPSCQLLVQTVYVSPDGLQFLNKVRVLRHLNLIQTTKKRKFDCLSIDSDEKRRADDKDGLVNASETSRYDTDSQTRRPFTLSTNSLCTAASCWQYQDFPSSPFGLLEELFSDDPWRLLISTIMLNRTSRVQVDAILFDFFCKWPDPHSTSFADPDEMSTLIQPLGIRHRRARGIIRFSEEYIELIETKTGGQKQRSIAGDDKRQQHHGSIQKPHCIYREEFHLTREEIMGLYNCGQYASDAYEIFIQRRLNDVVSSDHALQYFVDYHHGLRDTKTLDNRF